MKENFLRTNLKKITATFFAEPNQTGKKLLDSIMPLNNGTIHLNGCLLGITHWILGITHWTCGNQKRS